MTLRTAALCAGYGGLEMGLTMAGVDHQLAWYSELDDAPARDLLNIRTGAPNLGDLTAIHDPPEVDIVTAGFPCFEAGTLILTDRGLTPIEEVRVGDMAWTHKSRWRPITAAWSTADKAIHTVRTHGAPPIQTTSNHPFWAARQGRVWNNARRQYDRTLEQPAWTDAGELASGLRTRLQHPTDGPSEDVTAGQAWVLGRFLGDGWTVDRLKTGAGSPLPRGQQGRVVICCGKHEADELKETFQYLGFTPTESNERTGTKFHFLDQELYRLAQTFDKGATNKTVPLWIFSQPDEIKEQFLEGYISADGYDDHSGRSITTSSRRLAVGVAMLWRSIATTESIPSIKHYAGRGTHVIEGRKVNDSGFYTIGLPENPKAHMIDTSGFMWGRVKWSRSAKRISTVYNIAVEEDETYVADGITVHNCQPFSQAGLRKGVEDERFLIDDVCRVAANARARWLVLENVAGILSANDGRALSRVCEALARSGFVRWEWGTIRASDVGACHQRRRWFCVATAADADSLGCERWDVGCGAAQFVAGQRWPVDHEVFGEHVALPTPTAAQAVGTAEQHLERKRRGKMNRANPTCTDLGLLVQSSQDFGKYAAAIERHEVLVGRPAPAPTVDSRLNPVFVEWMMGIPEGHVTDLDLSRAKKLHILGNGVVPQQAAAAITALS